jgi:hypothetical protein
MLITVMKTKDVWVQAVHHGGVGYFCVGCGLKPEAYLGPQIQDCLTHLAEHRAAGHLVDPAICEELQQELELCNTANERLNSRIAKPEPKKPRRWFN